jgi:hypothetical protein
MMAAAARPDISDQPHGAERAARRRAAAAVSPLSTSSLVEESRVMSLATTSRGVSGAIEDAFARNASVGGRQVVNVSNWGEVLSRNWRAGDRFCILGPDGTSQFFKVTRDREGGEPEELQDFESYRRVRFGDTTIITIQE